MGGGLPYFIVNGNGEGEEMSLPKRHVYNEGSSSENDDSSSSETENSRFSTSSSDFRQ